VCTCCPARTLARAAVAVFKQCSFACILSMQGLRPSLWHSGLPLLRGSAGWLVLHAVLSLTACDMVSSHRTLLAMSQRT
jgi:hypothetical protein